MLKERLHIPLELQPSKTSSVGLKLLFHKVSSKKKIDVCVVVGHEVHMLFN